MRRVEYDRFRTHPQLLDNTTVPLGRSFPRLDGAGLLRNPVFVTVKRMPRLEAVPVWMLLDYNSCCTFQIVKNRMGEAFLHASMD